MKLEMDSSMMLKMSKKEEDTIIDLKRNIAKFIISVIINNTLFHIASEGMYSAL